MKRSVKKFILVAVCISLSLMTSSSHTLQIMIPPLSATIPPDVNNGLNAQQVDYDTLSWQQLVALNWPAVPGHRGVADPNRTIGDGQGGPVVWETWKEAYEIFLPDGSQPPGWNQTQPSRCTTTKSGKKVSPNQKVFVMMDKSSQQLDEVTQPGFGPTALTAPLIDQNGMYLRYEVRINQAEFDYIFTNGYYNSQTQKTAAQGPNFKDPPGFNAGDPSSIEVKAAWRVMITPQNQKSGQRIDDLTRYYTAQAVLYNPNTSQCSDPVLMGLVGFHMLRLIPNTGMWFWSTFEQVDNLVPGPGASSTLRPSLNPGGSPPPQYPSGFSYRPDPIPPATIVEPNPKPVNVSRSSFSPIIATPGLNAAYQAALPAPFKYYQLIGSQNPQIGGNNGSLPNTHHLTNVTMETFAQTSSCFDCHNLATPIGGTQHILTFVLQRAGPPLSDPSPPKMLAPQSGKRRN